MILFLLKMGGNWWWYSTYTLNSWKIISNTQILSFCNFFFLSMWILNHNSTILFLLKTGGNWQWYSAYTPNSWKIISNAQILSLCNNSYTYQCRISIVIQWFHFYYKWVETDDDILHILWIVGKLSVTHKFHHFVTHFAPIDTDF